MGILDNTRDYASKLASTSQSVSKFDVNFEADELELYVEFREYLLASGFKRDSASSYVTNHKRVTCKLAGIVEGAVTSDENSAIRKFDEFEAQR